MIIDAKNMQYAELNKMIRDSDEQKFTLENVLGQRYIGAGLSGKEILIKGTPGNALGAYLNGAKISVHGNAQDATGDTMNDGAIIIHGNSGDTTGYAMRSGEIYVQGNAGYRVGIHMKSYQDMFPTIVIGGKVGDFLRVRRHAAACGQDTCRVEHALEVFGRSLDAHQNGALAGFLQHLLGVLGEEHHGTRGLQESFC